MPVDAVERTDVPLVLVAVEVVRVELLELVEAGLDSVFVSALAADLFTSDRN